ncbi:hypothetical protein CK203_096042 [Vitis vinifera]|uniref:Uncharacterized protein n=1 Tax=Vitis vinifera TaxID=29760 RepID=A0A438CGQ9_VITVI|nr:hypothetical protein CK203_096042 [Vitis vinifera]
MARRFGGSNPRRPCASQTRTTSEPNTYYARTTDEPNRHRARTTGKPNRHRACTASKSRAHQAYVDYGTGTDGGEMGVGDSRGYQEKALIAPKGHHGTTLGVPRTHGWHSSTHTWAPQHVWRAPRGSNGTGLNTAYLLPAQARGWQLASGNKSVIRTIVSYKGLVDGCELMVGAKRHLGLKKCLQLGGYTSSSPAGWLCLSFKKRSPRSLKQSMRAWDSYGEDIAVLKKTVLQGCSSGLETPPKVRVLEPKGFNGNRNEKELENFLWDME